ncbi:hypothetical protein F4811DRAFT_567764 [Daldinia bambusicola]|nr:hypothetical protein F4811DRAFT_567764 [Daldinia bambusicola]
MSALKRWVNSTLGRWQHQLREDLETQPVEVKEQPNDLETEDLEEQSRDLVELEEQPEDLKAQPYEQTYDQSPMLRTLSILEQTMDPLLAAQVYNAKYNRLCSLPDELLLAILHYIDDDGKDRPTMYCLGHVSQKLRRLVALEHDWWRPWELPFHQQLQFRQRLRKDKTCDMCRNWRDWRDDFMYRNWAKPKPLRCKFRPWSDSSLALHGPYRCVRCHTDHSIEQLTDWGNPWKSIGRRGAVQLCEHIWISWTTIEHHILKWRKREPWDWEACIANFNVSCHDRSHDMRCTSSSAPSWPRARLRVYMLDWIYLVLRWEPHTGPNFFTSTPDGRIPAAELRAVFRKYREGLASMMLPSYPPGSLPEMACFSDDCTWIRYEMEDDEAQQSTAKPQTYEPTVCIMARDGQIKQEVLMTRHYPRHTGSLCLQTTYEVLIPICRTTDGHDTINPTHEWLHAMDPDTYPHPESSCIKPLCKNKDCIDYYRMRKPLGFMTDSPFRCNRPSIYQTKAQSYWRFNR